jgi:hypothetical protein
MLISRGLAFVKPKNAAVSPSGYSAGNEGFPPAACMEGAFAVRVKILFVMPLEIVYN